MHGIIFQQLQQFVIENYGVESWAMLLDKSGLKGRMFLPTQVYPDADAVALIIKAGEITKIPVPTILESFGEFIAPSLLRIYSASLKREWTTIDLLENVENTIHRAVRFADKKADPPKLNCKRLSDRVVSITYSSHRKMIEVGIGIIKAIAKSKNEIIDIKRKDLGTETILTVTSQ